MKNTLKILLALVLCLSLLMVVGCSDKKTEKTEGGKGEPNESIPEISIDPDEEYMDGGASEETHPEGPEETTEPPIGVNDYEDEEEGGADFEVDFGEITG